MASSDTSPSSAHPFFFRRFFFAEAFGVTLEAGGGRDVATCSESTTIRRCAERRQLFRTNGLTQRFGRHGLVLWLRVWLCLRRDRTLCVTTLRLAADTSIASMNTLTAFEKALPRWIQTNIMEDAQEPGARTRTYKKCPSDAQAGRATKGPCRLHGALPHRRRC